MHCQWRGGREWRRMGLPLTTGSEEACKLYDAIVTQYAGFYDDASLGGIGGTLTKLTQADPDFVMGQVVNNGLEVLSTSRSIRLDPTFKAAIDKMVTQARETNVTEREKKHAEAVRLFAEGDLRGAAVYWEDILLDHPTDVLATKFAHDAYLDLGASLQMRDSIGRVLPHWSPDMPLYGYLLGMQAFGLEESNMYSEAEQKANEALEINPRDAWATHALCHVMEMQGRPQEGINMMTDTDQFWTTCSVLACHNYWHWALYYIEIGDYEAALSIFDEQVSVRATESQHILDIVDVASLLFRLQMEGIDIGDRWNSAYEYCKSHIHEHILSFNDLHMLLSCLGSGNKDTAQELMDSIEKFVKDGQGHNQDVAANVGHAMCKAFVAYDDGDYASAVELLAPVRYKVATIGGSHAQRDLVNLFLIQAAIKSPEKRHHRLARSLINERKAWKSNAPMTDRLMAKAMEAHAA